MTIIYREDLFFRSQINLLCKKEYEKIESYTPARRRAWDKKYNLMKENVRRWAHRIKSCDAEIVGEEKGYSKFEATVLVGILGYDRDIINNNKKMGKGRVEFSFRNKKGITSTILEAKGLNAELIKKEKGKKESAIVQARRYIEASSDVKYGLVTNYNKFYLIESDQKESYYSFDFMDMVGLDDLINDKKLMEFYVMFRPENIVDQELIIEEMEIKLLEQSEFTNEFYKIFNETRLMIIKEYKERGLEKNDILEFTTKILNRLLFIFFVEDRGFVEKNLFYKNTSTIIKGGQFNKNTTRVYDKILELFRMFTDGNDANPKITNYNGGLFKKDMDDGMRLSDIHKEDFFKKIAVNSKFKKTILKNEAALRELMKIDERLTNQKYILNPIFVNLLIIDSFDFESQVGVDILGHIFEQSISDLEKIEKTLDVNDQSFETKFTKISRRKDDGVYYTPSYITKYISQKIIVPYLSNKKNDTISKLINEYKNDNNLDGLIEKLNKLKILDPSCGSGAFLLMTIDILLEIYNKALDAISKSGGYKVDVKNHKHNKKSHSIESLKKYTDETKCRMIIENNIYGIDVNLQSVEITQLSIFLKLIEIDQQLPNLTKNIITANSMHSEDLDISNRFKEVFEENGGFDIILGNPPYIKHQDLQDKELMEIHTDRQVNLDIPPKFKIPQSTDLSGYFVYHSISYLRKGGMLGFISSETWMNSKFGEPLQNFLKRNCKIHQICRLYFNPFDADTRTAIIILERNQENKKYKVEFVSAKNPGDFKSNVFSNKILIPENELKIGNWIVYLCPKILPFPSTCKHILRSYGKVSYGVIAGEKNFFEISDEIIKKYKIDSQFLKPTISDNTKPGKLKENDATKWLLNVNIPENKLEKTEEGKNVLEYINDSKGKKVEIKRGADKHSTRDLSEGTAMKNRDNWYSLELTDPPTIFLRRILDKNLDVWENDGKYFVRNTTAYFNPGDKDHIKAYLAYFITSHFQFQLEVYGSPMAGGALSLEVYNFADRDVPNFSELEKEDLDTLKKIWDKYHSKQFESKKQIDAEVLPILGFKKKEIIYIQQSLLELRVLREKKK